MVGDIGDRGDELMVKFADLAGFKVFLKGKNPYFTSEEHGTDSIFNVLHKTSSLSDVAL